MFRLDIREGELKVYFSGELEQIDRFFFFFVVIFNGENLIWIQMDGDGSVVVEQIQLASTGSPLSTYCYYTRA